MSPSHLNGILESEKAEQQKKKNKENAPQCDDADVTKKKNIFFDQCFFSPKAGISREARFKLTGWLVDHRFDVVGQQFLMELHQRSI
jgi:hypothetical protein